ncbi:NAD(P)-binding protein [Nonomuraea sp. NPDC052116]|uniref:NAD(P)-binding protein n=1 Tax=Nonomuraea sp. NPDC052116 TaxID=3155665 RepID=UPI0034364FDC
MESEPDYIIVGSGAAGSVLAHRLSQHGRYEVLVLEAGGPDSDEQLLAPANFVAAGSDTRYTKQFATEPSAAAGWSSGMWDGSSAGRPR